MKKYLTILIFILFLCLANQSEARKLALLVGVDNYIYEVPDLRCCVNDMRTLKSALQNIGFKEDDVEILTTSSSSGDLRGMPLKGKIEEKIQDLLSEAGPSDMIFIAFSGHGFHEGDTDYFCPSDAKPNDISGTCVSIPSVMEALSKSEAKFKWIVVDACRTTGAKDARAFQAISRPPEGIALFQSCKKGQQSYEEERDGGNGYFTKNLAAALSGDEADANHDGKLTLMEALAWTTEQTKAEVKKIEKQTQTPFVTGEYSDFPLMEDLNFPKAEALAKEAQAAMNAKNYSLALSKFDAALALCPRIEAWKEKREFAKQLRDMAQERDKKQEELEKLAEERKQEPIVTPSSTSTYSGSRTAGDRKVLTVDGIEYAFRWCPPGEFMMGSPESEPDRFSLNWEKQHRVRLTQGFWLLETEVTQEMWESVMGENPSCFKGSRNPVERVSWNDSQEFCRKLGQKLNREIKLPTEAQWEYACRAGSTGAYAGTGNLDSMGWYEDNSDLKTHEVGLKRPNDWGFYDMHGNVREWCSDYWDEDYYAESPTSDPENTSSSASPNRVSRGGSWRGIARYCRSANRSRIEPDNRYSNLGLRVLLVPSSRD